MSIKKLQDLLNPGSQNRREMPTLVPQVNRSPVPAQSHFSPLGSNSNTGASRSPSYPNFPGVQNMFYHPLVKNPQETVCPSPMFQMPPPKKPPTGGNSIFQGSRFTAAETNPTNTYEVNNISNSTNTLHHQFQPQFSSQPKNLEELLQRSFSMPSNSVIQSPFNSGLQSPFIGGNPHMSQVQPPMASEISSLLNPMTLFENSIQNTNLFAPQNNKPQSNEASSKALIIQLAQILKQESETKIKSAIAELILKYKALGLLNNLSGNEMLDLQSLIKGAENPQNNHYQYQPNHQEMLAHMPQQNPVPLSNGLAMNVFSRNDQPQQISPNMHMLRSNIEPNKVNETRRQLFAINDIPMAHQHQHQPQPIDPYERNMIQGNFMQQNQHQMIPGHMNHYPISPINTLDQEMDSLTLSINFNPNNYTNYGITSILSAPERMEDISCEDLRSMLKNQVPNDDDIPGVYNKHERINKILKYKNKIRKWRSKHPVKRMFKGRSVVAGQKPRIKGKFVTIEEYTQYVETNVKQEEFGYFTKEEEF